MRDELLLRPKWLEKWPGFASLIEPSIGSTSGVPDVHLVADEFLPGWVEFKALEGEDSNLFKIRPEQKAWMRDYLPFDKRVALCLMDKKGWCLLPVSDIVQASWQRQYVLDRSSLPSPFVPWEDSSGVGHITMLEVAYAQNAVPILS